MVPKILAFLLWMAAIRMTLKMPFELGRPPPAGSGGVLMHDRRGRHPWAWLLP
jgi:hypothetical protein